MTAKLVDNILDSSKTVQQITLSQNAEITTAHECNKQRIDYFIS